jgi:hypothetical protein
MNPDGKSLWIWPDSMSWTSPMPEGVTVHGAFTPEDVPGLIGVPSRHHDPYFARIAQQAIERHRPSVIALELPSGPGIDLLDELDWAASCWPTPMVSATSAHLFPFVPGDSIFEAFRCARARNIPVNLVDLPCTAFAHQDDRPEPVFHGRSGLPLPDVEWHRHDPALFLLTLDAVLGQTPPTPSDERDLAREAWMAGQLHQLLRVRKRVLWVGGMAHWTRIVHRLRTHDFSGPRTNPHPPSIISRMRLAPSALYRMTGRLPWLVLHYADNPDGYDEHAAIQTLARLASQRASRENDELDLVLVAAHPGTISDTHADPSRQEPIAPVDVAKTLLYARNLAAVSGPRERPDFTELLTSAAMIVSPWYAGRLYVLAMREAHSAAALTHDALEFEYRDGRQIYHSNGAIIDARPWQPEQGGSVLTITEVRRRARKAQDEELPAAGEGGQEDDFYWISDPGVEEEYTCFQDYLLRRASLADPEEARTEPFQTGLADGIDVRATVRYWAKGKIHVRDERRGKLRVTNAAIDWTGRSEHSDILQGRIAGGGWVDPSLTRVGSCSRMSDEATKDISLNPYIRLFQREFSLITLDSPTYIHQTTDNAKTFFDMVIEPLIKIQTTDRDTIYNWLEIMFRYCSGKPFAYFSSYVLSPRIHRIAWEHGVRIMHIPLHRVPETMRHHHAKFRYYKVNREQWVEFMRRQSEGGGMWGG